MKAKIKRTNAILRLRFSIGTKSEVKKTGMMRNVMRYAIGVVCVIGVCGCAYVQGTKVPDATLASFTKGKTTKDEVVAALGGPQDIKFEGGKQILTYKYQKIASFTGNEGSDTILIFNDKGILGDILKSKGSSLPNPLTGR